MASDSPFSCPSILGLDGKTYILTEPRSLLGRYTYHGRHRGVYQPSIHWGHTKCYPGQMCLINKTLTTLKMYQDVGFTGWNMPEIVTFSFAEEESDLAVRDGDLNEPFNL